MIQAGALGELAREPVYNTRAVAERTGVPADTFRAWERRYGVPRPDRAAGNQRLYAEFDTGQIAWLRDRTTEGMQISLAVQRLKLEFPAPRVTQAADKPVAAASASAPLVTIQHERNTRLVEALLNFDTGSAARMLDEACALFSVEAVCADMLYPVFEELDARRMRGASSLSQTRFATGLLLRRVSAIFDVLSPSVGRGTLVTACAPPDADEAGLLLLSVCLARRGWRVLALGVAAPTPDLVATVRRLSPDLVCLTVGRASTSAQAIAAAREISRATATLTVITGGQGGAEPMPAAELPARTYRVVGDPAAQALAIEQLLSERRML